MFNLNQAIRDWKNSLRRNETMEDADLVEMESFLRDEIDRQRAAGLDEEAAYRAAVAHSAPVDTLGQEYGKYLFHKKRYPFWHPARFMPALAWNYVKVAVRKMKKQKAFTFINVAGLAAGMFACLLIFLWVRDDLSYDSFHTKAGRIYRIIAEDHSGAQVQKSAGTPAPLGPALAAEIPEIEAFARVQSGWDWPLHKGDGQFYNEERLAGVDPSFFELFDFPSVSGDPKTVLKDPSGLLITENLARKFFGDQDPIGKTLKLNMDDRIVKGVLKKIPRNSHFDFSFAISLSELAGFRRGKLDDWNWNQAATYLLLRPGARIRDIELKVAAVFKKNLPEAKVRLSLQPLKDIHLRSSGIDTWMSIYPNPGQIIYVYILSLTAVGILLLACLNFISLSTARYQARVREVGLRKVLGAGRTDLLRQFLGESVLLALLAFVVAAAGVEAILPAFGALLQKDLSLLHSGNFSVYAGSAAVVLITSLLAGIGPALFLSSFKPDRIVKTLSRFDPPGKALWRNVLVVGQFAATIVLIVFTLTVSGQIHFIQTTDKGFEPRFLIHLLPRFTNPEGAAAWKTEALRNPDILAIAAATFPRDAAERGRAGVIEWEGKDPTLNIEFARMDGDEDMLALFRMKMAEGRYFSGDSANDRNNWVLNETAVEMMGLQNPVGRWLSVGRRKGLVIGIVRDFHFGSLHNRILPRILGYARYGEAPNNMGVRYRPGKTAEVLAFLKNLNDRFLPNTPFQYGLIEETIDQWYATEQRAGTIFRGFAALAVMIAALGILGLASFMAERRTKEIGIRKILGASVPGIFALLSRRFLAWVLLANLFSWPAAYFFARNWLKGFAYRIDLNLGLFLLSMGLTLTLTLVTVGYQAVRAAMANPVDNLRYE